MFYPINNFILQREKEFDAISSDRKRVLDKFYNFLVDAIDKNNTFLNVTYICTHNSRRSQFGQIAAALAASYYSIKNVTTFSGGTEITAFNINAINALKSIGFLIETDIIDKNPKYNVQFSQDESVICFSKIFNDATNPQNNFVAILTCSSADEACPIIPGAEIRFSTPYEDPKKGDGKENVTEIYLDSFKEILRETLYVFSKLKT